MINTNDVFRKIKEMSNTVSNPRPSILINDLASALSLPKDQVLPSLIELKQLRLINAEPITNASVSIKLTLLGYTVTR